MRGELVRVCVCVCVCVCGVCCLMFSRSHLNKLVWLQVIGMTTHFFLLTTFAWTVVQSCAIHTCFVTIFNTAASSEYLYSWSRMLGYLVPFVVVAACACASSESYYNSEVSFCVWETNKRKIKRCLTNFLILPSIAGFNLDPRLFSALPSRWFSCSLSTPSCTSASSCLSSTLWVRSECSSLRYFSSPWWQVDMALQQFDLEKISMHVHW